MAIYIDREECPDVENIPSTVFDYLIRTHQLQLSRLDELRNMYLAQNKPPSTGERNEVSVVVDYPKYIVDVLLGMYLGDPIKYVANEDEAGTTFDMGGVEVTVRHGEVIRHNKWSNQTDDIREILYFYNKQTISEVDTQLGTDLGIYGEAYELIYATEDGGSIVPKSTVCDPRCSIMVRDNSVEHKKMFFMTWEKRQTVKQGYYYAVTVYTDKSIRQYRSSTLYSVKRKPTYAAVNGGVNHFFGEVPAVEYSNNAFRMGDYEACKDLINGYNMLMSDRLTDKRKFIDSILALYNITLTEDQQKQLEEYGTLDGLPVDAKIEYIQKVFDESQISVLAKDIVREIHKISMSVDITDDTMTGSSSGIALRLKLMAMNMSVKNKIRSMEKGLRKRFEIYNHFLYVLGVMELVDKSLIEPVFTVSVPVDESEKVQIVKDLQGIVDDETLLSLLWFVKNPEKTLEKVRKENADKAVATV